MSTMPFDRITLSSVILQTASGIGLHNREKWSTYGHNKPATVMALTVLCIIIHEDPIWVFFFFNYKVREKSLERFSKLWMCTMVERNNTDPSDSSFASVINIYVHYLETL